MTDDPAADRAAKWFTLAVMIIAVLAATLISGFFSWRLFHCV